MTCRRSKQCDNADICQFAQSTEYNLLGGSCFEPKDPQTNEEWLKHCNTEQLADVLAKQKCDGCNDEPYDEGHSTCKYCMMQKREQIMEWLKQPHSKE